MITIYDDRYKEEVINLILHVQNVEYGVGISVRRTTRHFRYSIKLYK